MRTAAPHWRIGWKKWRTLREPSVSWLPYFSSSPGACTTLTRDQSASISSATIIGRLVRDAGAHLRAGGDDRDDAVRVDRDEDMRVVHGAVRHGSRRRFPRPTRARRGSSCAPTHQRAGGDDALQHVAAADIDDAAGCGVTHSRTCVSCHTPVAARRTAAAMR